MKRLPLLWRVFLSTSIVTTLLFGLIAYLAHTHAIRAAESILRDELQASFRAYESLWQSRAGYLASISQLISGMPDVRGAFSTGDAATIRDTAGEVWSRVSQLQATFLVTDPAGRVIASLGRTPSAVPDRIDAVQSVASDFPKQASGFAFLGDRLHQVVITPVYVDAGSSSALINVLVTGLAVDDAFAGALKNSAGGSDAVIVSGDRVLASTIPQPLASRLSAVRERFEQVRSGEETWSVLTVPLGDLSGQRVAELRVLRPLTAAARRIRDLRWEIFAVWALAILFALLVTYVLARRLLRPMRELDEAAQQIRRGNYDYRVPVGRADDEMGRLGRTFNAMCESISSSRNELVRQERINALGRVASSIVHDLRNPLAAIYGGAEMLVDSEGLPPAHTKRLADNIYRASRQILHLLDDLSAIRRGKDPDPEQCVLADVIDDAWSVVAQQAESAGVALSLKGDRSVELPLSRARIERVFTNLFVNSIQAMRQGGQIHVSIERTPEGASVRVRDTGPGVAPALRASLFQPFATAGKSKGFGLGLALSRQTVIDHGGDLTLEDSGSGACFHLRLPKHA